MEYNGRISIGLWSARRPEFQGEPGRSIDHSFFDTWDSSAASFQRLWSFSWRRRELWCHSKFLFLYDLSWTRSSMTEMHLFGIHSEGLSWGAWYAIRLVWSTSTSFCIFYAERSPLNIIRSRCILDHWLDRLDQWMIVAHLLSSECSRTRRTTYSKSSCRERSTIQRQRRGLPSRAC